MELVVILIHNHPQFFELRHLLVLGILNFPTEIQNLSLDISILDLINTLLLIHEHFIKAIWVIKHNKHLCSLIITLSFILINDSLILSILT
jgi:hypothetical protein